MMPPRAVAITFDDAYLDVLEEAAPTLLRNGIPATVFATTAPPLDTPAFHYWWDILEWAVLSATSADSLTVWLDDGARTFPMGTTTARRAAHHAIHNVMVPLDARRREDILEQLLAGRDPHRQRLPRRLSAIELRALGAQSGFTIGAHGHDHLALPAHPVEQQRLEIVESRMRLEALLEREVRTFAYPFGAWSRSTAEIARAAGMRLALTCEEGPIRDGVDPLACPRVGVPPSTPEGFVALVERTLAPGYEKRLAED
jgi:peptidoglycan/xylan/chitin deacetylase (PgdA/CDA1 family)